ncbi:MAG: acetylserotonin O-methyltransferase [Verrucomicrobiales bacterium]|nr:acetylserotonin O-methyltransferase [Verrucomicrobiales bacterium]
MLGLITGYWITQLIYVAAKLGLADRLAGGPKTSDDLAADCGVQPRELHRLLRALASEGVFQEAGPRTFANTPLSDWLRQERTGSLHARAIVSAEKDWPAWGQLLHSIRTGQCAFDAVFGADHFAWLSEHPDVAGAFNQTMTQAAAHFYRAVVEAYDFSPFRCVVDIGGGHGQLLALILARHATARGILFDAPRVIETAGELLRAAGVAERCELRAGDFFEAIPAHGDAYLMSHLLHDWDDEHAKKLLTRTRRVTKPGTRLLIIEKLIPPGNEPSLAKLMDIHMLVLSGGLERTEEEYRRLLADTGFRLERIVPTASIMSVLEAVPL